MDWIADHRYDCSDMTTLRALFAGIVALVSTASHADPQGLEAAKASARRIGEATCPLARMVSSIGKMEPGSPGYQALQVEIDKESKALQDLKVEETEKIRALGPQLTNKEGRELNEYIDKVLSKTCDVAKP
jgi:hypothetical protein